MAVKRGKSQARRNSGSRGGNGLPGWAWLVLGVALTLAVVLLAPRWLKSDGSDGFIRPRPNPDARPQGPAGDPDDNGLAVDEGDQDPRGRRAAASASVPTGPEFDFYTLLPGQEVALSDAELAASARAEAAQAQRDAQLAGDVPPAGVGSTAAVPNPAPAAATGPARVPSATPEPPRAAAVAAAAAPADDARYLLQAGAFGASGDAEALKARIALLGLGARVESATIAGKTVYRVRMGPYGTASELAEAKAKLGNGGLPAMAIKAQ